MTEAPLGGALWPWSLERYGREGVAPLCLHLQDEFGANVNLVLACAWSADYLGLPLSEEALAPLMDELEDWSRPVTRTLRSVRRFLKAQPAPGTIPPDPAFREEVKALELQAERLEQAFLAESLTRLARQSGGEIAKNHTKLQFRIEMAQRNLDLYGQLLHIPDQAEEWRLGARELVRKLFTALD